MKTRRLIFSILMIALLFGCAPLYDPEHGWPNIVVSEKKYHYLRVVIS
jgi:hypothetical protein